MPFNEYLKAPGLSSSNLMRFHDNPDSLFLPQEPKGYYELGHAFEDMIQDRFTGSQLFDENYYVPDLTRYDCDIIKSNMPARIYEIIEAGDYDLKDKEFRNKPKKGEKIGALSATYKVLHRYLTEAEFRRGKPISKDDYLMLRFMYNNFLKMQIWGLGISDILKKASFQVSVFWEQDGIQKKCRYDIVNAVLIDNKVQLVAFDIKTNAAFPQFITKFKRDYWIQDRHYCEGLEKYVEEINFKNKGKNLEPLYSFPAMVFLVSVKKEPYTAQPFHLRENYLLEANMAYYDLVQSYQSWDHKLRGYKDLQQIGI